MLVAALLTLGAAAGWQRVTGPPALVFPRDDGAHPEYQTEWWYVTGVMADADGRRFGYQLTFFREGLEPGPLSPGASDLRARQVVAANLAVADVGKGRFASAERLRRVAGGLAGYSEQDLKVWCESWQVARGADGSLRLTATDPGSGLGLALELRPTRPLVRQGDAGYSRKGPEPGNASAYLSWTRMATAGELTVDGRTHAVTGTSWLDHEWGTTQLGVGVVGWDWFGLRLSDGRDLMLYRLRRGDGSASPYSAGTMVASDGSTRRLAWADVKLAATGSWASPLTGAAYPSGWRLDVPSAGIDVTVTPLVRSAEVDARRSTGAAYWEGPVEVAGSTSGEGYVELTGHAGRMRF